MRGGIEMFVRIQMEGARRQFGIDFVVKSEITSRSVTCRVVRIRLILKVTVDATLQGGDVDRERIRSKV